MATQVNMHKAKSDLARLVALALEGEEVIIMRAGKPVARLVPIFDGRQPGTAGGRVHLRADLEESLPARILDSFEGG